MNNNDVKNTGDMPEKPVEYTDDSELSKDIDIGMIMDEQKRVHNRNDERDVHNSYETSGEDTDEATDETRVIDKRTDKSQSDDLGDYNYHTGEYRQSRRSARMESKRRKRKKNKSFMNRVLYHKDETALPLFIFEFILAFIADTLKILLRFALWIIVVLVVICVCAGLFVWHKIEPTYIKYNDFANEIVDNSTKADFKPEESSYVYASDGSVIAKLQGDEDSIYITYDNIPEYVDDAFIAIEDQSYWDNPGIDLKGIIRVVRDYVTSNGDDVAGASTITQQLARGVYLTNEVSMERKFKEMLIAIKLTKKYTKKQIMEFYVNNCYFANGYYGIEAAAHGYFSKSVSDLTLSEIAYLCAIPNSPTYYDPIKYPEHAIERRNHILENMVDCGYIDKSQCLEAESEEIALNPQKYNFNNYQTTYAVNCAVKYLMKLDAFTFRYSFSDTDDYNSYKENYNKEYEAMKDQLYTGGYKIYTSLNPDKQKSLQDIVDKYLSKIDNSVDESTGAYELQSAVTAIDNTTGKVIAIVGGRTSENQKDGVYELNRAYQSNRQPGSTIKPLVVYTPALMNGYTPSSIVTNIDTDVAKQKGVNAQTLGGEKMTLQNALTWSKNGVAWQIFDKLSPQYCLSFLANMDFASICPDDYTDAAALGGLTYGTTTEEMAGGYNTLVSGGSYTDTTCLLKLIDSDGNNVYTEPESKQVYTSASAKTISEMLTHVINEGTARGLGWSSKSKMIAAGKTGTTNNNKDGWFCGYTPYYTVSVWVGYDTPRRFSTLQGASYPGEIWRDCMLKLIDGLPVIKSFDEVATSTEIIQSDDTESDTNKSKLNSTDSIDPGISEDGKLPDSAYEKYLPGRDDAEVLSPNYTVYDYRKDHTIADSIDAVIEQMNALDKNDSDYKSKLDGLYKNGQDLINSMYGVTLKSQKTADLNNAYGGLSK